MYKQIRAVSFFLRWYVFSLTIGSINFEGNWYFPVLDSSIPIPITVIFAFFASLVLQVIGSLSYDVVGIFYSKGENSAVGSFMYLVAEVISVVSVWIALSVLNAFGFVSISSISVGISIAVALTVSTILNLFVLGWISNKLSFLRSI